MSILFHKINYCLNSLLTLRTQWDVIHDRSMLGRRLCLSKMLRENETVPSVRTLQGTNEVLSVEHMHRVNGCPNREHDLLQVHALRILPTASYDANCQTCHALTHSLPILRISCSMITLG